MNRSPETNLSRLALALLSALILSCNNNAAPTSPEITAEPGRTSRPSSAKKPPVESSVPPVSVGETPLATAMSSLQRPDAVRYSTPGMIRMVIPFSAPINEMHMTPLGGVMLSSGDQIYNVTSRGHLRWQVVAGRQHQLLLVNGVDVLWSKSFQRISALQAGGRTVWKRDWNAELSLDQEGNLYAIDAASLSSIGADGKDRWRATLNDYRRIEGPYQCNEGILFQGSRGLTGSAILISFHGAIIRETELARGAIVLGVSASCNPIIWLNGKTTMLDSRGGEVWSKELQTMPLLRNLKQGLLMLYSNSDNSARALIVDEQGRQLKSATLPVDEKIIEARFVENDNGVALLGLCLGVASHCARPRSNRGPFNAVLAPKTNSDFSMLFRSFNGHSNFVSFADHSVLLVDSDRDTETELTFKDKNGQIIWSTTLPGRFTSGPISGLRGELYIGTCEGWECTGQSRLFSVTAYAPVDEESSDKQEN